MRLHEQRLSGYFAAGVGLVVPGAAGAEGATVAAWQAPPGQPLPLHCEWDTDDTVAGADALVDAPIPVADVIAVADVAGAIFDIGPIERLMPVCGAVMLNRVERCDDQVVAGAVGVTVVAGAMVAGV